jgi:hypothetical protein
MENNSGVSSSTPSQEPSAAEARRALEALAADRRELADRMATPTWYHPALAALVFILVAGYGFERLFLIALVLYSAGLVALVTAYRRITGVWSANLSRIGARRYAVTLVVVLLACLGLSNAARTGAVPWWWALIAGAVCGLAFLWVGPRVDAALRSALRESK